MSVVLPVGMEHLSMRIQHKLHPEALDAESLVHKYHPYLYRLVYSIVRDPAEADDITQETFVTVFKKLEQFEPGSNFRAWLSTIAVNKARDRLRQRRSRQRLRQMLQTITSLMHSAPSPEEELVQKERKEELWAAVETLHERHRLPVILRYVHNLPISEIAEILEVKEGTVHSRLYYATEKLGRRIKLNRVMKDE